MVLPQQVLNIQSNNMARVTLEDGRVINFEGTPSQSDIDEVVASLDVSPVKKTNSKSFLRPKQLGTSLKDIATEEFGSAAKQIQGASQRERAGEQGVARTGFTAVAQGAQAGLSTAFRGALTVGSAALPDFIENPIRRKLGDAYDSFIESNAGQKLIQTVSDVSAKVDQLEPKNQQLVKDAADAALTGVDLLTLRAGSASKGAFQQVGAKAGAASKTLASQTDNIAEKKIRSKLSDLIIDTSTPTKRAAVATRTTEGGLFTGRTVKPTRFENQVVDEMLKTPNIKPNRSALTNLNAVNKAVAKEADSLKSSLKDDNFIFPKKELSARLDDALSDLKLTDPGVIGDSEKLADRLFDKAKAFINDSDGTGLGALRARQQFDDWITTKRPKAFEKQDSFNTIARSARKEMNDFLAEKAVKTDVKASLSRQSRLMSAQDVLRVKSGKESATGFVRLLDKATEALGTKNRVVQLVATAVGIGGLGAAATFAPAVAAVGGVVGAALLLIKALKSGTSKKALAAVLKEIEKQLPKASQAEKLIYLELRDEIQTLLEIDEDTPLFAEEELSEEEEENSENDTDTQE